MLQQAFFEAASHYTSNVGQVAVLWREIEKSHSEKNRHYHNLHHLENVLAELTAVRSRIEDWDCIVLAIAYHDIVYKVSRKDNEEKSAQRAADRLGLISVSPEKIVRCKRLILATRAHQLDQNADVNYFTDADLSILGSDAETYWQYTSEIRREYSLYPDLLYKPGRKKVLQHFLSMDAIFKTAEFKERHEKQARLNLEMELQEL